MFTSPATPFDAGAVLADASLRRYVGFCVVAGVHDLLAPVNTSAFSALTEYARKDAPDEIMAYCRTVAGSTALPTCSQIASAPIGTPPSAAFILRRAREIARSAHVAEETRPVGHVMSARLAEGNPVCAG